MKGKTVEVNGNLINIDAIIEISEIVNKNERENLLWGFSIVLQDHSIINVVANSQDTPEDNHTLVALYQMLKNYLLSKTYTSNSQKS